MKKILRIVLTLLILLVSSDGMTFAGDIRIDIFNDNVIGDINQLIYGSNIIAYDPSAHEKGNRTQKYVGYSNYGAGVWEPRAGKPVKEVMDLIKNAGITILRFPGSTPKYNWRDTVGSIIFRRNNLFGLDEFLKIGIEVDAEIVYSLPYYTGSIQDAADLVEYLNSPNDGSNPGGGKDWAAERAKNGNPTPYFVKYFELGSEVNFGVPAKGVKGIKSDTYAKDYLRYRSAMKVIDQSILLGAVTVNSANVKGISAWNDELFRLAGHSIDFLIEHTYRPWYTDNKDNVDFNKLFSETLQSLDGVENSYQRLIKHFQAFTGRKKVPIAVTEYNAGFIQDRPVPLRHSLGAALFNAGLLQIFMKPQNNILMANYWQHVNSYWGMIKNDYFMQGKGDYIKRPNHYALEMYTKHFGTDLIEVKVTDGDSDEVIRMQESDNLLANISWRRNHAFGATIDIDNDDTVKVEFTRKKDINFAHVFKKVSVKPDTTYLVSGYIRAEELSDYEGVCIEIQDDRGWNYKNMTTEKIWGTTDWMRVEAEYTTLDDASGISVIVRRISGQGPITGIIYARDIRLVEKSANKFPRKDSLMVTASSNKINNMLYVMVLNKNMFDDVKAFVNFKKNKLSKEATAWILNGPEVQSTNEINSRTITIVKENLVIKKDKSLDFTFPAHSLTSLQFSVAD